MQHQPFDEHSSSAARKMKHEANFIAARIACPQCIASGEWKNSLGGAHQCEVCGPERTITFSRTPFRDTEVDKQVHTSRVLEAFIQWILYELPLEYDTYAYSHYGGRFDMVMAFRELYLVSYSLSDQRFMNILGRIESEDDPEGQQTV